MSLLIAIKCGNSVVLCADSQETRDDLKSEVDKIHTCLALGGVVDLVHASAGSGELSNAFRMRLVTDMTGGQPSTPELVAGQLRAALAEFHSSPEFVHFPGAVADKYIAGFVSIRLVQTGEVSLFKYFGTVVDAVATYGVVGQDYPYVVQVAQRLYRPDLSLQQSVLFGLEVLAIAKSTSIYVGGQSRVVVVSPEGVGPWSGEIVLWTEAHISRKNMLFDEVSLACADLTVTDEEVQRKLSLLSNSITAVRGIYGSKLEPWPRLTLGNGEPSDENT